MVVVDEIELILIKCCEVEQMAPKSEASAAEWTGSLAEVLW